MSRVIHEPCRLRTKGSSNGALQLASIDGTSGFDLLALFRTSRTNQHFRAGFERQRFAAFDKD